MIKKSKRKKNKKSLLMLDRKNRKISCDVGSNVPIALSDTNSVHTLTKKSKSSKTKQIKKSNEKLLNAI